MLSRTPWLRSVLVLAAVGLLGAERPGPARNAILFVGDGMGVPVLTAARLHAGGPASRLAMELPNVALVRTYSLDRLVPDSAATATAMFSGVRVNSGTLGMSPDTRRSCSRATRPDGFPNPVHPCGENTRPLNSIADLAIAAGMAVGVVTTTRITHATPAALYAHVDERDNEAEIARQLVERGDLTFIVGGGRSFFLPEAADPGAPVGRRDDGRDLLAELSERGYEVDLTGPALRRAVSRHVPRIAGLLDGDHLPFGVESRPVGEPPELAELTDLAIRHLSRHPRGYLLLVEGGRIDHALHVNAAHIAIDETLAFDRAVQAARSRVAGTGTLILVTADHGHPLVIAGYAEVDDPVLGLARQAAGIESLDADDDGRPDPMRALDGRGMTTLLFGNGPGHGPAEGGREDPIRLGDAVRGPRYRQHSAIPLEYSTHEGSDVVAAAEGPGAEAVSGFLDQTQIFEIVRRALGL